MQDQTYPSDEELYALLERAEEQPVIEQETIIRDESYLQALQAEVQEIQKGIYSRRVLAEKILVVLTNILTHETAQSEFASGFGSMIAGLGGGSLALRLFSDLYFRADQVCNESSLHGDQFSKLDPSQLATLQKNISVNFEHTQVLAQLNYIIRWYVQRARTLQVLDIDPRTKINRESNFALSVVTAPMAPGITGIKLYGCGCISGFASQSVTFKLVLKAQKRSVLLREGWESWSESIRAYFDEKSAPRACGVYTCALESLQSYVDYFELNIPIPALNLPIGAHTLQPVLRIEDAQGRGIQRVLAPIEVQINKEHAKIPPFPCAALSGITANNWITGDRIFNVKPYQSDSLLGVTFDLDLASHDNNQEFIIARLLTKQETWARFNSTQEQTFQQGFQVRLERPFHNFKGLTIEIPKDKINSEDLSKLSCWELRLADASGASILVAFSSI